MTDIFISYARSTADQAHRVAEALRALGYGVWRDDELPAHRAYGEVIEERLKAATAVVVIWSAEAAKSEWVRSEADRARGNRKLVQLRIDAAQLPMPFDQIQCADLAGWLGDTSAPGWRKVVASLGELLGAVPTPAAETPALALPSKPSIAVMPFANLSGDPEQAYFADGMLVEIVTALSAFPSLFVVAHATSLSYRGDTRSPAVIAPELGVRYVLIGSVRKAGERVRIAVELLDEDARAPIWTQRFDGDLEDVFALQDTVANAVASQIEPSIQVAEVRRATTRPTADPGAYDLYLRGLHAQWGHSGKGALLRAIAFFSQAIDLDPNFAQALARASNAHINLYLGGASDQLEESLRQAFELAKRAERWGADDAEVLAFTAYSLFQCGSALAAVEGLFDRAIALNPGSSVVRYNRGWANQYAGRPEAARADFELALRLDPRSPFRIALTVGHGIALFHLRRFAEALPLLHAFSRTALPGLAKVFRAACYGHLGRLEDARSDPADLALASPNEVLWLSHFRDPSFKAILDEGLALAEGATPADG